jgi:hypothetical protein
MLGRPLVPWAQTPSAAAPRSPPRSPSPRSQRAACRPECVAGVGAGCRGGRPLHDRVPGRPAAGHAACCDQRARSQPAGAARSSCAECALDAERGGLGAGGGALVWPHAHQARRACWHLPLLQAAVLCATSQVPGLPFDGHTRRPMPLMCRTPLSTSQVAVPAGVPAGPGHPRQQAAAARPRRGPAAPAAAALCAARARAVGRCAARGAPGGRCGRAGRRRAALHDRSSGGAHLCRCEAGAAPGRGAGHTGSMAWRRPSLPESGGR